MQSPQLLYKFALAQRIIEAHHSIRPGGGLEHLGDGITLELRDVAFQEARHQIFEAAAGQLLLYSQLLAAREVHARTHQRTHCLPDRLQKPLAWNEHEQIDVGRGTCRLVRSTCGPDAPRLLDDLGLANRFQWASLKWKTQLSERYAVHLRWEGYLAETSEVERESICL
eukprot:5658264-Pleurochrysis_carterae.AAC.2